ncbi:AraC family transcriptional regulator [Paenibacillus alkaliterrae]|uniref:AraC family transcriptional regulator n=1 Tax=Paenibacillus alkaliterrae TaxID=320909 RepID=UPI001F3D1AA5|nr:AraC family transcriptional regulator [Paenibacillus alkaliterrae]MCF2939959.1 AraC family transcriptional regulator [Paenibacillus alkaliterrae]
MDEWKTPLYQAKVMDEWITAFYRVQGTELPIVNFHSHHEYEIYFFGGGECKYLINNRIYDLQPGDIILLDGLTLHKPNPRYISTYTRSMLHFSPSWLQELLSVLGLPNLLDPFQNLNNCLLRTGNDESGQFVEGRIERIANLLVQMDEEMQRTGQKSELLEAEVKMELVQLLLGIYKMAQKEFTHVKKKVTGKEQHAEAISTWIDAHYTEKVSLDQMAADLNLSKYYASHIFKEVTGFTVMEYVMGCRLNQVKYLLEMEPDQSLTDVSRAAGFESVSHFSRYFKDKMGITPSRYRENKRIHRRDSQQ